MSTQRVRDDSKKKTVAYAPLGTLALVDIEIYAIEFGPYRPLVP
jgi:hypothetical protein